MAVGRSPTTYSLFSKVAKGFEAMEMGLATKNAYIASLEEELPV
jgi:hypothetical protein